MELDEIKHRKIITIVMYLSSTFILICGLFLFYRFYSLNKAHYIKLTESSKLDYNVCLKENDFFGTKCLDKDNQYVASLIDYIPASFNYSLLFSDNSFDYNYSYKIDAKFNVIDKDNKRTLFTKTETLYQSETIKTNNKANIHYDLNIDYNKYNDILNSFITLYDLDETSNTLEVFMHVNVSSSGNTSMDDISKDSVISLSIPLTRKTVNIDIKGISSDHNATNILVKNTNRYKFILFFAVAPIVIAMIIYIYVLYYTNKNKTVLEIYQKRIKKILNMYDSYIQRITGSYPIGASQICKVARFKDILEIKDSSDKPLLMLENEEKTGTFFIIPVEKGILYTYALRVEDIMAEKNGEVIPDYNIEDIGSTPKKYTKEKIKEDIEKTTTLGIIDDKNAIKGTTNTDESLYDQLEKTASFKIIKEYSDFLDSDISKKKIRKKTKKTKK